MLPRVVSYDEDDGNIVNVVGDFPKVATQGKHTKLHHICINTYILYIFMHISRVPGGVSGPPG